MATQQERWYWVSATYKATHPDKPRNLMGRVRI